MIAIVRPFLFVAFVTLVLALPVHARADSFTVITNHVPPFKFISNGHPAGMSGDLLISLFRTTGHTIRETRSVPMAQYLSRGYREPNTVFLCLSKSFEEGRDLKWVGPIYTAKSGIVVRKTRELRLARIQDARNLTLASVIGSAPEKGFMESAPPGSRFLRFRSPEEAVQALVDGSADGVVMATAAVYRQLRRKGEDTELYETALTLTSVPLFFAFHSDTPDHVIEELQYALDAMKQPNRKGMSPYLEIIARYY